MPVGNGTRKNTVKAPYVRAIKTIVVIHICNLGTFKNKSTEIIYIIVEQ